MDHYNRQTPLYSTRKLSFFKRKAAPVLCDGLRPHYSTPRSFFWRRQETDALFQCFGHLYQLLIEDPELLRHRDVVFTKVVNLTGNPVPTLQIPRCQAVMKLIAELDPDSAEWRLIEEIMKVSPMSLVLVADIVESTQVDPIHRCGYFLADFFLDPVNRPFFLMIFGNVMEETAADLDWISDPEILHIDDGYKFRVTDVLVAAVTAVMTMRLGGYEARISDDLHLRTAVSESAAYDPVEQVRAFLVSFEHRNGA